MAMRVGHGGNTYTGHEPSSVGVTKKAPVTPGNPAVHTGNPAKGMSTALVHEVKIRRKNGKEVTIKRKDGQPLQRKRKSAKRV